MTASSPCAGSDAYFLIKFSYDGIVPNNERTAWSAVILAGGRGLRAGGIDKAQLQLNDRTFLAGIISDIPVEVSVYVVGPIRPTPRPVTFVHESETYGGPVSALHSAVASLATPVACIIAVDMPRVGPVISRLARNWRGEDALIARDFEGRIQPLCGAYSLAALRAALDDMGKTFGASMHSLLKRLDVKEFPLDSAESQALWDVDVPSDLDRLK